MISCVYVQDEKNQILTTNIWLNLVSVARFRSLWPKDDAFGVVGKYTAASQENVKVIEMPATYTHEG